MPPILYRLSEDLRCPYCQKRTNAAGGPAPGDWSTCYHCGNTGVYAAHVLFGGLLVLRRADPVEAGQIRADPVIQAIWLARRDNPGNPGAAVHQAAETIRHTRYH